MGSEMCIRDSAGTRSDQPDGRPHSGQRWVSADRYARRAGWPRRVFFHAARQGNCSPDTKRRSARCGIQYRWYIRVQQPSVYAAAYGGARISRPARRLSPCALCRGAAFRQTGRHLRHAPARYRSRLDPRRRGDFRKPVRISEHIQRKLAFAD